MKIIYFANSNLRGNEQGQLELEKREKILRGLVSDGVDIRIVDNPEGPLSIETAKDEIQALPGTAKNLVAAQEQGKDGGHSILLMSSTFFQEINLNKIN